MPSRSILALPFLLAPLAAGPVVVPVPALAQSAGEAQLAPSGTRLAQEAPELRAVFEAMGVYEILGVMSSEGLEAATGIEDDMFPGQGGGAWRAVVAGIYATDRMIARFEDGVPVERMTPEIVAELQDFYDSPLGQRIARGEVEGRQALLDPGVEEAARALARQQAAEGTERMELLRAFSVANDFVERNVAGALNSNFAFYRGLSDGGAFETEIPQELMLAEVWGQEAEIRRETTEWLFGYQVLAYEGLSDAEMARYVEMSETEAGQLLNAVLFQAFDALFDDVSYQLGKAAATFIAGEET